jgi:CDP-alcohol phosphatidyltransferase-like enzyme
MTNAVTKARSLDESFDALVCRPLGRLVARGFMRTTVTANQVSGMAAFCGIAAGTAFAMPWPLPGYGAIMLFTMMVLDCADGEVARQRGGGGWRGRVLDGMADLVTAFAVHLGMLVHLARQGTVLYGYELSPLELFLIALGAGGSMAWRCGVVDDIKQRLRNDSIDRELAEHVDEPKTAWDRFLYRFLANYVVTIARYCGKRRPGGYTCFRRAQIVGPTHHHLAMVVSGLGVYYSPMIYLTFFVVSLVPANLYLAMVLRAAPGVGEAEREVREAVT